MKDIIPGLLLPFAGTVSGAACVFFMKRDLNETLQRTMTGFASGIMVAASVWSLLIPAMEQSGGMGRLSFLPAASGFLLGILFLLLLDHLTPHLHRNTTRAEGPESRLSCTAKMILAVTLHNIPEGMAVGVVYAGLLAGSNDISVGGAFALAAGIAIQNIPEGAIISLPLHSEGKSRTESFFYGVLSGVVEPVFGALTLAAVGVIVPAMPYLLSFAAGAMLYVVVEELIPEMSVGRHSDTGVVSFAAGFSLMMALDAALG